MALGEVAQWDFYVGQPKTKYQIFTCFFKFYAFILWVENRAEI